MNAAIANRITLCKALKTEVYTWEEKDYEVHSPALRMDF